jgi:hypothetical protein
MTLSPSARRKAARTLDALLAALPGDAREARSLAASVTDWSALHEEARAQGVDGVVFFHLAELGVELPASVRPEIETRLLGERFRQERLAACLDEVLRALEGIPNVAIKGTALAERVYPRPWLRRSTDVDVVVALADATRALAALEAIGFRDSRGVARLAPGLAESNFELDRAGSAHVELHFRLFIGFGSIVASEGFLERSIPHVTRGGAQTRVFGAEDELLYLTAHAAGSWFARASWLYDLKLLLLQHPATDVAAVLERARELGLETAVRYGFTTLHRRLAVSVPSARGLRFGVATSILRASARLPEASTTARAAHAAFRFVLSDRMSAAMRRRLRV